MTESRYPRHVASATSEFAGREWLFHELQSWLAERGAPQIFLITGPPGSGKTAIAARLLELSEASDSGESAAYHIPIAAAYFCSAADLRWTYPWTFIHSIVDQLASRFEEFRSAVLEQQDKPLRIEGHAKANVAKNTSLVGVSIEHLNLNLASAPPQETYTRFLLGPLHAAFGARSADEPVVLLVDALDEATMYRGRPPNISDLLSLTRELPPCIRLILTSRPNTNLRRFARHTPPPRQRDLTSDALELGRDDARAYLEDWIRRAPSLKRRFAEGFDESAFLAALADKCNANFLFLRALLSSILHGDQIITRASLDEFPSDIDGAYLDFLDRMTWARKEDWRQLLQPVLGILSVSATALGPGQLAAYSSLSERDVRTVLSGPIRQLLDEYVDDGMPRYSLYHRSFSDFLTDAAKSHEFWCDPAAENRRIATRILDDYAGDPAAVYSDTYALTHGIDHMTLAALDEPAGRLLADFHWLEAKVTKTDVIALLSDFDRISCSPDLIELQEAIQLSQHVLAQHPEQLGPQLEARLDGGPGTVAESVLAQLAQRGGRRLELVSKSLPHPHGPEIATLLGHDAPVTALACQGSDGNLYSADSDGRIVIWNLATRRERTRLETGSTVRVLALPSRDLLASGHDDGQVRLWNQAGDPLDEFRVDGPVVGLAAAAQDLVVLATAETFQVWNLATRALLHSAPAKVFSLVATRSNRAVTLHPSELTVWDVGTGEKVRRISGRFGVLAEHQCTQLSITPDGRRAFVSKGHDGVSVYDLDTGECEVDIYHYHQWVNSAQVFADGRHAAVSFANLSNEIAIIDLQQLARSSNVRQAHSARLTYVTLSVDERILASAAMDGTIKLWRPERIQAHADHDTGHARHTEDISALVASPRGTWIASASKDYGVILWNGTDGTKETERSSDSRFRAPVGGVAIAFSADEEQVFTGSPRGTVKTFRTSSPFDEELIGKFGAAVVHLETSSDGHWLLVGLKQNPWLGDRRADSSLCLVDLHTQDSREVLGASGRTSRVRRAGDAGFDVVMTDGTFATIDPTRRALFRAELKIDGLVDTHRLRTGVVALAAGPRSDLEHTGRVRRVTTPKATCLAIDPDRSQAVAGDELGRLWLIRGQDHELMCVAPEAHEGGVIALSWIEPHIVISGSRDRTVAMWDTHSWTLIDRFEGESHITHLCYVEGSGLLAAGESSGRVHFLKPHT